MVKNHPVNRNIRGLWGSPEKRARVFEMSRESHRNEAPRACSFAVLTVSDTRSEQDDQGGGKARELAAAAGHREIAYAIVRDEPSDIREAIYGFLEHGDLDAIVVTGGTGYSPRDRTVEAVSPLFDRLIEGFGELFRMLSWDQVGAAAMLSRATAGVIGRRAVFLLPGSPKAVDLALSELILPELGHLIAQLRKDA